MNQLKGSNFFSGNFLVFSLDRKNNLKFNKFLQKYLYQCAFALSKDIFFMKIMTSMLCRQNDRNIRGTFSKAMPFEPIYRLLVRSAPRTAEMAV